MEEISLDAVLRSVTGKAVKRLRGEGFVPAVMYGHRTEPVNLQIDEHALHRVLKAAGANRLISLSVDGLEGSKRVLVRELQRDAITHAMLHVDLYEVVMTEEITAEVPVILVGQSPLIANGEGILFQGLDTIEIECLPGDLPPNVEVGLAQLNAVDDAILVRDLDLGAAVKILSEPEDIVVKILPLEAEIIEEVVEEEVPEVELVGVERPEVGVEVEAEAEEEAPPEED
ncbi:MAG: 50S ribosomal protein L25 [Anaerolineales bacterium]|nr:MAG: 50S ribosomal protein L25 [Anaerolineales bacterium]